VVRVPEPVRSKIELNEMVGDMVPFLQGMAPADMALIFEPHKEEIEVEVDLALMQQVIVNIVKNAIESINREDGIIRIVIYVQNERPVLEIANNGEPISEEVSTQLFSPFFTTKREGRGIGLTLISEILNRHNASYSLKTGSDGITRFQIQL
ncbi:MAG: GHKL domain-containing protein, partial [Muribaculaceae bacterium]|nr:GHKL domain-containing protein [Muribaculaceae bacterium]